MSALKSFRACFLSHVSAPGDGRTPVTRRWNNGWIEPVGIQLKYAKCWLAETWSFFGTAAFIDTDALKSFPGYFANHIPDAVQLRRPPHGRCRIGLNLHAFFSFPQAVGQVRQQLLFT